MRSIGWFIALRYLFTRERRALISIITSVATLGVAIGVAVLIVVISVMDGAEALLFSRMAQLFPHVQLEPTEARYAVEPDAGLLTSLRADPRVELAEPILRQLAVLQPTRAAEAPKEPVSLIALDEGTAQIYSLAQDRLGEDQVLLGEPLAQKLGIELGQRVFMLTINPEARAAGQNVRMVPLEVVGFFSTGFYEFDEMSLFIDSAQMRRLFQAEAGFDYIHVKLHEPMAAAAYQQALALPPGYRSSNWSQEDRAGSFFHMLTLQKYLLFVLLMMIIVVAAFNIIGTLILMVNDKTREIGILRAIGGGRGLVARVFLIDGILIGLTGTALGVVLGLAICAIIPLIGIDMPASTYNFETLPVQVRPASVAMIVGAAMLICTLAAFFPARHAARLKPVEALRYD